VGERQLELLDGLLVDLKRKGCYRAVMLHHPPLPGLTRKRKALKDASALQDVLAKRGAELVIHGHNHRGMHNTLDSVDGPIPVVGVSSASIKGHGGAESASWNLYQIRRSDGRWVTDVIVRGLDAEGRFATVKQFTLSS
jgi:3',5'-cyclic AMP phosphodiesterase CpdA